MDRIPIYARGGAVIPMWPEAPPPPPATTRRRSSCTCSCRPRRRASTSLLHEDDGLTFDGGFLPHDVHARRAGARCSLTATVEGDGYPEFARERFELVVHGGEDVDFKG